MRDALNALHVCVLSLFASMLRNIKQDANIGWKWSIPGLSSQKKGSSSLIIKWTNKERRTMKKEGKQLWEFAGKKFSLSWTFGTSFCLFSPQWQSRMKQINREMKEKRNPNVKYWKSHFSRFLCLFNQHGNNSVTGRDLESNEKCNFFFFFGHRNLWRLKMGSHGAFSMLFSGVLSCLLFWILIYDHFVPKDRLAINCWGWALKNVARNPAETSCLFIGCICCNPASNMSEFWILENCILKFLSIRLAFFYVF